MNGESGGMRIVRTVWLLVLTVAVAVLWMRGGAGGVELDDAGGPGVAFSLPGSDQPVVRLTASMPDPQVGGTVYPRSVPVAGLQFMDAEGDEMGGFGIIPGERRAMILCFDYETAEAVCLSRIERDITFTIQEPPAPDAEVGRGGPARFTFGYTEADDAAYLRLSDGEGRTRIRLEVDSAGAPVIETLDADGRVRFSTRGSAGMD